MTVDAYWRILWYFYGDVVTSVWENHLVIEDSSTHEEGNDGEQLCQGRIAYHGHIYHSVVWNGIRGLTEAQGTTDAHGYHAVLLLFVIDSIFHFPEHTLEKQEEE